MRFRFSLFAAAAVAALALAGPGAAHHGGACPPDAGDTGREFAQQHIVPRAQSDDPMFRLGQGHKPGMHKGFSGCHPQEDAPGQQP